MSDKQRIIRFETNGPAGVGLQEMQLDPAGFKSDDFLIITHNLFSVFAS